MESTGDRGGRSGILGDGGVGIPESLYAGMRPKSWTTLASEPTPNMVPSLENETWQADKCKHASDKLALGKSFKWIHRLHFA